MVPNWLGNIWALWRLAKKAGHVSCSQHIVAALRNARRCDFEQRPPMFVWKDARAQEPTGALFGELIWLKQAVTKSLVWSRRSSLSDWRLVGAVTECKVQTLQRYSWKKPGRRLWAGDRVGAFGSFWFCGRLKHLQSQGQKGPVSTSNCSKVVGGNRDRMLSTGRCFWWLHHGRKRCCVSKGQTFQAVVGARKLY